MGGLRNIKLHILTAVRSYRTKPTQKKFVPPTATSSNLIVGKKDWILDSGAPHHATGNERTLHNLFKPKEESFAWPTRSKKLPIENIGDTVIVSQNDEGIMMVVPNVCHVPGMNGNYLSVHQLCEFTGCSFLFGPEDVKIFFKSIKIGMKPVIKGGLLKSYYMISSETACEIDFWIVSSGSTDHITGDEQMLHNLSRFRGKKLLENADDSVLRIAHIGDTTIFTQNGTNEVPLHNVLHIPGEDNLLSVARLTDAGYSVLFDQKNVKIFKHLEIVAKPRMVGRRVGNHYVMSGHPYEDPASSTNSSTLL